MRRASVRSCLEELRTHIAVVIVNGELLVEMTPSATARARAEAIVLAAWKATTAIEALEALEATL